MLDVVSNGKEEQRRRKPLQKSIPEPFPNNKNQDHRYQQQQIDPYQFVEQYHSVKFSFFSPL
jgi:hypothetical protein